MLSLRGRRFYNRSAAIAVCAVQRGKSTPGSGAGQAPGQRTETTAGRPSEPQRKIEENILPWKKVFYMVLAWVPGIQNF